MRLKVFRTEKDAAAAACQEAARTIRKSIASKGMANVVFAAGKSQVLLLNCLVKDSSIDWSKVELFHLDEFYGLPENNKSLFSNFLKDHFVDEVNLRKTHFINSRTANIKVELSHLNKLMSTRDIDLTFLGIGENGHLAFNDPPADFKTTQPYILVTLADHTKRQEVKEGLFSTLSAVPSKAISMSIHQILTSKKIICLAFGRRKAKAVRDNFREKTGPHFPASALRRHRNAKVFVDEKAALLLS